MSANLIAVLVVLVAPALWLASRLGLMKNRVGAWLAGLVLLGAVLWSCPWSGIDLHELKKLRALLAGLAALVLLLQHLRTPFLLGAARRRLVWAMMAGFALLLHLNFLALHGERQFVHLHDVAHYYLGAKYFEQVGYSDLYVAMLQAENEIYGGRFESPEARDLASYERMPVAELLARSDEVKARFSPSEWEDFRRDTAYFRDRLGPDYRKVMLDHGFNPTPVWVAIGAPLARLVPAASSRGLLLLSLADPVLLAVLFLAIGRAFGVDTLLCALTFFPLVFGAGFGWVGGAFLRYLWLAALVLGIWSLSRRRGLLAGCLFALSASLRVFPALLILPLVFKVLYRRFSGRQPSHHRGLLAGLAIGGLSLFLLSGLLPRGFGHWTEFRDNMQNQVRNVSPNLVGLTEVLDVRRQDDASIEERSERRSVIRRLQWLVVLPVTLLVTFWVGRWQTDLGALALGVPIVFAAISLAAYYWVVLLVLLLYWRRFPERLALLFAVEAASFLLYFFEARESLVFGYRSGLVLFLCCVVLVPQLQRALALSRFRTLPDPSAS